MAMHQMVKLRTVYTTLSRYIIIKYVIGMYLYMCAYINIQNHAPGAGCIKGV